MRARRLRSLARLPREDAIEKRLAHVDSVILHIMDLADMEGLCSVAKRNNLAVCPLDGVGEMELRKQATAVRGLKAHGNVVFGNVVCRHNSVRK